MLGFVQIFIVVWRSVCWYVYRGVFVGCGGMLLWMRGGRSGGCDWGCDWELTGGDAIEDTTGVFYKTLICEVLVYRGV